MNNKTAIQVNKYLNMNGEKDLSYFNKAFKEIVLTQSTVNKRSIDYEVLDYLKHKMMKGAELCTLYGKIYVIVDEENINDILEAIENEKGDLGKIRPKRTASQDEDLGKLVDRGDVPPTGRSDQYWRGAKEPKVIFKPDNDKVRKGMKMPKTYAYNDYHFLERFYNLKGIEFGNWLSQQDRFNYVAGLGIALYDLSEILGFSPKQLSINGKVGIAFGARGRGAALAHFEPGTFFINLTRYQRPKKGTTLKPRFDRTKLLTLSGGVGSFAHEFGHALDYYAGMYLEKNETKAISFGHSLRTEPDKKLLKENSLTGLMERLLNKIIWKNNSTKSDYYKRLEKQKETDYYYRRNEIFARAFESYVHLKMAKKKYYNVFLAETKYPESFYMNPAETKRVEKDFDALVKAIKGKLK